MVLHEIGEEVTDMIETNSSAKSRRPFRGRGGVGAGLLP